jgi:hypothetical protein
MVEVVCELSTFMVVVGSSMGPTSVPFSCKLQGDGCKSATQRDMAGQQNRTVSEAFPSG